MKNILLALVMMAITTLSGCASMFNGSTQQVSIRSNDKDAKIYVNGSYKGDGNVVTTFKKKKNYTITVESDNEQCKTMTMPVSKSFDATTLLGVFIDFGIVSILVVDGIGTGAIHQFDQTSYIIDPICS